MDRTSKVIFALIAAGLWFNVAANLLRPAYIQQEETYAQQEAQRVIKDSVQSIAESLVKLLLGSSTLGCMNPRLCGS
jgi:hypothetical protein